MAESGELCLLSALIMTERERHIESVAFRAPQGTNARIDALARRDDRKSSEIARKALEIGLKILEGKKSKSDSSQ
jgi:hypothetical protein